MANQKITVEVDVQSNTAKETTQAERLGAALKDAAASAQKIRVPGAGATTGVGAVMARSQPVGAQAVMEYGAQRGVAGATGAAARDFAKQSEALGGLVRVYAAIAANVYAVGAAFRVLSDAMDTTNMIKGLDQLGAATGKSLGGLSKQFQATAGGAISLREAMEATVKASSSGMAGADILRLGTVAQKASAALGVNMSDAVSRLTRGITKLEPELLDELGIFTKIEPAVEKYARTVGKSATSLTDFERRQAFANAVLEEAEQKFGKINIDVNPYTKLAATFSDLLSKTLEFVNIGLKPLVTLLNTSPAALLTVVTLLGTKALKAVLPQLADFKKSLQSITEVRAGVATQKRDTALTNLLPDIVKSRSEIDKRNETFYDLYSSGREKLLKRLQALGPLDPRAAEILTKKVPGEITADDENYIKSKLRRSKADKAAFAEFTAGNKGAIETDLELQKNSEKLNETINKRRSIFTALGQSQREVDNAYKASVRSQIVSEAARIASTEGLGKSLKTVWKSVGEAGKDKTFEKTLVGMTESGKQFEQKVKTIGPGLNILQQGFTGIVGTATAVTTSLFGIGKVIVGTLLPYLGLATVAFALLKEYFGTSAKESAAFATSIDVVTSALDNVDKTLENISNKKIGEVFTVETVQAQATALNELSTSFDSAIQKADKLSKAQSGFDKGVESIYKTIEAVPILGRVFNFVAGESDTRKLAKSISNTLNQSLRLATSGEERNKLLEAYSKAYGIDPETLVDRKKFQDALEGLSFGELTERSKSAADAQKTLSQQINISAASLTELRTTLEQTAKEVDNFIIGIIPSDPFSKLGISLLNNAAKIEKALDNPKDGILALQDVVNNFKTLAILPPDVQDQLLAARDNVKQFVTEIDAIKSSIAKVDQDLQSAQQRNETAVVDSLKKRSADLQKDLDKKLKAAAQFTQQYTQTLQVGMFDSAMRQFDVASKMAGARGAITAERGALGVLAQAGVGTAESEGRLKQQEFAIQRSLITAQTELAISVEKLRAETALSNSINELQNKINQNILASQDPRDTEEAKRLRSEEIQRLGLAVNKAKDIAKLFESGNIDTIKGLKEIQKTGTAEQKAALGSMSGLLAAIAGRDIQLKEIAGAESAAKIEEKSKALTQTREVPIRAIQRGTEEVQKDLEAVRTQEQLSGIYNEQLATRRRGLEAQLLINTYAESELKLNTEIERIQLALTNYKFSQEQIEKANAMIRELNVKREINLAKLISDQTRQRLAAISEQLAADRELFQEKQRQANILQEQQTTSKNLEIERQELEFQRLSANDQLVKSVLINERARIDLIKAELDYSNQVFTLNQKEAQLDQQRKEIEAKRAGGADVTELETRLNFEFQSLNTQRALTKEGFDNRKATIAQTKELSLEQERYNKLLENANSAAESIQVIFSGMGDAATRIGTGLADMTKAFTSFAIASEKGAKALADIAKNRDDTTKTDKERAQFADQYNEQLRKNTKDELTGTAQIIGSAKKMFKEKSAGYKVLGTVEKGLHIARLAMDAMELKTKLANVATELGTKITAGLTWIAAKVGFVAEETAAEEAGFLARSAILIKGIFLKVVQQLGWPGVAVAAAIIASLGLSANRKPAAFKPTIDQQIEVQGTGQRFNSQGQKVATGGGVLGDPTAKMDSLRKATEIIRDNSTESLLIDNKALATLERIATALDKTAIGIFRNIPGLNETKTAVKQGFGSIFGASGTREVTGITFKLQGSLDDLADKATETVQGFDTITQRLTRRILGIRAGTSSTTYQQDREVPAELAELFGDIFAGARDLIKEIGLQMGQQVDTRALSKSTAELVVKPGMKLEDITTELNAITSEQVNKWARELYPAFDQFSKAGEEYAETVLRVVTTNNTINESLKNLGTATTIFGKIGNEVSEQLVASFGGTQELVSAFETYGQRMFTEQEQMERKRATLATELNKLGLQDIKTKAQYNDKVQELIRDGKINTDTFKKLILLAPQFADAVEDLENRLKTASDNVKSEYDRLKQVRDTIVGLLKGLKDFKDQLLLGAQSYLTPGEQYLKAKQDFEETYRQAKLGDADAISNLSKAGSTLADKSRLMFASSEQYTSDVNSIIAAVDEITGAQTINLTTAERQLAEAEKAVDSLKEISTNTKLTVQEIGILSGNLANAVIAFTAVQKASPTTPATPIDTTAGVRNLLFGGNFSSLQNFNFSIGALDTSKLAQMTWDSITSAYKAPVSIGQKAEGSNYIPRDQISLIHEGERIIPAADNRQLMRMMAQASSNTNDELYDEVCRLTKQVETLTQVVADGAIMNAQATDRNTEQIANTIQTSTETTVYNQRVQAKVGVV